MEAGAQIIPRESGMGRLAYPGFQPVPLFPQGNDKLMKAYGGYGDAEGAGSAAAVVGIGIAALVLTVGFYVLLAYGVGWGASKGWQYAKKRKRRKK